MSKEKNDKYDLELVAKKPDKLGKSVREKVVSATKPIPTLGAVVEAISIVIPETEKEKENKNVHEGGEEVDQIQRIKEVIRITRSLLNDATNPILEAQDKGGEALSETKRKILDDLATQRGISYEALSKVINLEDDLDSLKEQLRALNEKTDELLTGLRGGVPIKSDVIHEVTHFTGREKEMEAIKEFLESKGGPNCMVISGTGGIGKSSLVRQVAATVDKEFEEGEFEGGVYHINANSLQTELERVARKLGWKEEDKTLAVDHIEEKLSTINALLVIDNVNTKWTEQNEDTTELSDLPTPTNPTKVLITTRESQLYNELGMPTEALEMKEGWSEEECRKYIRMVSEKAKKETDGILSELSEFVGRLPLGIRLVSKLHSKNIFSDAKILLENLKNEKVRFLDKAATGVDIGIQKTFMAAWNYLDENAKKTLLIVSFGLIMEAYIKEAGKLSEKELSDALIELDSMSLINYEIPKESEESELKLTMFCETPQVETINTHDIIKLFVGSKIGKKKRMEWEGILSPYLFESCQLFGTKMPSFFTGTFPLK